MKKTETDKIRAANDIAMAAYTSILAKASQNERPFNVTGGELKTALELDTAGLIRLRPPTPSGHGLPGTVLSITPDGRLFLMRLVKEREDSSAASVAWRVSLAAFAAIVAASQVSIAVLDACRFFSSDIPISLNSSPYTSIAAPNSTDTALFSTPEKTDQPPGECSSSLTDIPSTLTHQKTPPPTSTNHP